METPLREMTLVKPMSNSDSASITPSTTNTVSFSVSAIGLNSCVLPRLSDLYLGLTFFPVGRAMKESVGSRGMMSAGMGLDLSGCL